MTRFEHFKRYTPLWIILAVNIYGVCGYIAIEGWSFTQSFYMTVITLTTTGYGEVAPLSDMGRYFTITLMIGGISSIAYGSTQFFSGIIEGIQNRGKRVMNRKVSSLSGHTIVLGYGRMGKAVCSELEDAGSPFVVIEHDSERITELTEAHYPFIDGSGANDENLVFAGIARARCLVSVIDNEADCLFAAVAAKSLNPNLHVIVRADSESSARKMKLAGADEVVLPLFLTGKKVAQKIIRPELEGFLSISSQYDEDDGTKSLEVMHLEIADYPGLEGKTLRNCGLRRDGLMILGVKSKSKGFEFAPPADYEFQINDVLITVGTKDSYSKTHTALDHLKS